jgi:hypothetical protein
MLEWIIERLMALAIDKAVCRKASRRERSGTKKNPHGGDRAAAPTDHPLPDSPVVIGEVLASGGRGKATAGRGGKPNRPEAGTPVALTMQERLRQTYVCGKTGTGKTAMQTSLLLDDVAAGRSVCLLDMRGDLVDRALLFLAARYTPEELSERLVVLDLRETAPHKAADEPTVCFNPVTQCASDPFTSAFFMLDILRQQWGDLGVQMQETLRNSLLVLSLTGSTLLEMEPLLTRPAFRRSLLHNVTDSAVLRFWERFDAMDKPVQTQWTQPVLNKLSVYLSRPRLRAVLTGGDAKAQSQGSLSMRSLLERPGVILLCCFAADELFKQTAGLIGNMVTAAITRAVMRSDRDAKSRAGRTVHLMLDEFENLASQSAELFEEVLAEGRRFGLHLTASHQAIDQIPAHVRSLIRNICATHLYFAVGGADADTIAGELPTDEPRAALRAMLSSQPVGTALLLRQGQPLVRIRTRYTRTPTCRRARSRHSAPRAWRGGERRQRSWRRGSPNGRNSTPPSSVQIRACLRAPRPSKCGTRRSRHRNRSGAEMPESRRPETV